MKMLKTVCIICLLFVLAACNQSTAVEVDYVPVSGEALTQSQKQERQEERLIESLQAAINEIDGIQDTMITVTSSEENKPSVDVVITTERNTELAPDIKEGIINLITGTLSNIQSDDIHLTENQPMN